MKSPKVKGIGEVVTEYGAKVMKIFKKGLLQRSLFDFYGDVKANAIRVKESSSVPQTPVDNDGGVVYVKNSDGKLYYKSNEVSEIELSASDANTQNTTTLSFVDSSNDILLRNTTGGAGSGTDDIKFVAGANITLTHTDADNITIASTDTNTTYSIQDGELSQNNFTNADHTKLNGIEENATADQTNVTGSSGSCTGNAATATALTTGDKTINGDLTVSSGTSGEATLTIISDTDNNDENDNPFLVFTQDGGAINGYMGLTGDADKWPDGGTLTGATPNALVLGTKGPTSSNNSQLFLTAGDAIRLTILNNGKVGIGTTTPSQALEVSGNIELTGLVRPGISAIKILHSDFIADDVGRPAQIDDIASNKRFLKSHSTAKLYASVDIPLGFKATAVNVFGNGTSSMSVHEMSITSKTVNTIGNGNIGTTFNFSGTPVNGGATSYLLIELAQTSSEEVYGGAVTIAKI